MSTPLADLYRFIGERTSFTEQDAHVFLLGCLHDVTFDETKGYLQLIEEQGKISNRRADSYNRTVYVTHE